MIERRVVVKLEEWDRLWEKYLKKCLSQFDQVQKKIPDTADNTRLLAWNKECAGRELQRLKGELEGSYSP